jgi:predicted alpha/beta-hydrolase family hydrolase
MASHREPSTTTEPLTLDIDGKARVSALWMLPSNAHTAYVLAHGAGAGMNHSFMSAIANELAGVGVATLRYQFPYMESKAKRPDSPQVCHATVRTAVAEAARRAPTLRLIAGGKSFGGRMTSQAQAVAPLIGVRGLVFLGFPLHPPKKPGTDRAQHLSDVKVPMLFLQGTRDELADLALLEPIVDELGERASLRKIEGADHSFHVLARSGRKDAEVLRELAREMAEWAISL